VSDASGTGASPRVHPVPFEDRDGVEAFIRFPWSVYEGDECWVAPLLADMRTKLDPDAHPFHRHSDVQLFLATRDGRPVGRIAAIHNRRHVGHHDEPVGFFGFFECERSARTAGALFDAAGRWLRDRGLEAMRGPASFSTNEEAGLLVQGFGRPPCVMMPYNPPWYEELIREHGFREARTLVAYWHDDAEPPAYLERAEKLIGRRYPEVSVRAMRMDEYWEEVERIQAIYNAAWRENWGFVPMTDAEFRHMARDLRHAVDPGLALIAEDGDGEPVAFSLSLPDVNQALRHADGRLFPFGLLKILWHRRKIDTVRVVTLGVVEAYRGKGIDALLYLETFRRGAARGYYQGEFSWILEDNEAMRRPLEKFGARIYKRYRLYDRPL
jgi:GNAT superfamily N-acetyltransferase